MSGRERDRGRKYQSGATKRKEKLQTDRERNKLRKLTSWLQSSRLESTSGEALSHTDEDGKDEEENNPVSTECPLLPATDPIPSSSNTNDDQLNYSSECALGNANKVKDYEKDIGLWPDQLSEEFQNYWTEKGSAACRNIDSDNKNSDVVDGDRTHHCTKNLFSRKHTLSGEQINLSWLCYSEERGCLFGLTCCRSHNQWLRAKHSGTRKSSYGRTSKCRC